jgi:D-3-phosphoglycerate dehydrogenase
MVKVVLPDDSPPAFTGSEALARLRNEKGLDVHVYTTPPADQQDLLSRIEGAHTVINVRAYCKFPRSVLKAASSYLKHVAIWGTGTDAVDLEAARELGIVVSNTPDTATDSVAEHTLTLMLAVARQIPALDSGIRNNRWVKGSLVQLEGKTLGIIGTGVIGCRTAQIARGIGMQVIAWSFNPDPAKAEKFGFEYTTLDKVLRCSDVISLHIRSTPETKHFIDAEEFSRMKPTAILVNTARGSVINEEVLVDALRNNRLAGAGLDVFEEEPLPNDHPLTKLPNVVMTPHTAGTTPEALANGLNRTVDNVLTFIREGSVVYRVV